MATRVEYPLACEMMSSPVLPISRSSDLTRVTSPGFSAPILGVVRVPYTRTPDSDGARILNIGRYLSRSRERGSG
jgi:hypothetical protein